MTPNTLIGRTFGSLTQGEREGLPCGTTISFPDSDFPKRKVAPNVWMDEDGDTYCEESWDLDGENVIVSIPTTPDPDEAKAREALAEWDAPRCGVPTTNGEGIAVPCSREPSHRGTHLDLRPLPDPVHLRTALRLLDAERALVAGVRGKT